MNRIISFSLLLLLIIPVLAQPFEQRQRWVFYNTENFFDPADNPDTEDDDFTPQGSRHWNYGRMKEKYNNLAKVLIASGEGMAPAVIGLAEVENDSCIYRLLHNTPLYEWNYRSVVTRSLDRRGINVALLYQSDEFRLLGWESWRIEMPQGNKPTRDLLHAWGRVVGGDTVDVVIAHLPSRRGGARQSAPAREAAQSRMFIAIDSLNQTRSHFNVVVMGDMNDMPTDVKLPEGSELENLMLPLHKDLLRGRIPYGSHKYQGEWGFLDQIWVNRSLIEAVADKTKNVWVDGASSVAFPFMLTEDNTHLGHRPLRSFYGYNYEGGFSDHLPVKVDLHIRY